MNKKDLLVGNVALVDLVVERLLLGLKPLLHSLIIDENKRKDIISRKQEGTGNDVFHGGEELLLELLVAASLGISVVHRVQELDLKEIKIKNN